MQVSRKSLIISNLVVLALLITTALFAIQKHQEAITQKEEIESIRRTNAELRLEIENLEFKVLQNFSEARRFEAEARSKN